MTQQQASGPVVQTTVSHGIAWVTINNPPVNATSAAVRAGLMQAVAQTDAAEVRAVILRCDGRTFVAGADIREFGQPPVAPLLSDVVSAIEQARTPWIAAIHGTALGGGLELCLACAYRVAGPSASMGLPEVGLGLIPGAGGTVRLPRLIDPIQALELVSGGKPVPAERALQIGLVDRVAADDTALTGLAEQVAREAMDRPRPVALLSRTAPKPDAAFRDAVVRVKRRARGQNSILAAAAAVERALLLDGPIALAAERDAFATLKNDPQSMALRHIFFAERSVSKIPRITGTDAAIVKRIGVIGGGTMGSGIAVACLLAGLEVTMIEQNQPSADTGREKVHDLLQEALARGRLSPAAQKAAKLAFRAETDYDLLADADVVIEAVFEAMDAKRAVFAALDRATRTDTILATNTSYLDVAALAGGSRWPGRVIGLHFFSPAHIMKLLEVVVPQGASDRAVATGMSLAKRLGKIAVPAGVCDGFIGNRIMSAYRQEADYMIEDGAWPQDVDAAMRRFGFPIGIFQMQDLAGLDIGWAMRKRRSAVRPPNARYVRIADTLCEAGRFGRKSGAGWYDYATDPNGAVDPLVTRIIAAESDRRGIDRQQMAEHGIMARLLNAMQTEGRAVLADGIAASAAAIDVVMVNGYGFPRWRGGPMFMADGEATE